ncbi:outer membrane protein assembly factor BamB family protein [Lentibacillus salinarum]|uniref:PQQ-binding-like beta-propeller repeat protein n=1 Tax=Lentibacillus salinarum TaxID=446820 RepID=A0ABW3ZWG9_9BACI
MKRKARWLFLLALFMVLLPVSISASSSWPTLSKDQQRTHEAVAQHTQPPLYLKWQIPNIGWSISQPIVANGYIFHQAGGYLYKIPSDMPFSGEDLSVGSLLDKGAERVKISNDYHATSHPVYDTKTDSIYVGTGDDRIRKINPNTLNNERTYRAGARLVNAPTMLGEELIAFGNGDAVLKFFKGSKGQPIRLGSSPMEITGTPAVKEGNNPIIFVPVSYQHLNREGFVDAFRVIDNGFGEAPSIQPVWSQPFTTDNGVSTTPVYDEGDDRVYFADKSGTVYAVDASTGEQIWKNEKYSSYSAHITLVNNSPALSGDTLVVPFRYQDYRETGMVAAFDEDNGNVKWTRTSSGDPRSSGNFDGEIANDPTINTDGNGNSIVMVGTTNGQLRSYDLETGEPHFITKEDGDKKYVLNAIDGSGSSYYQGEGLATEVMIADGHIVFGANTSAEPNSSGTNGTLYAYSTPWEDDHPSKDLSGDLVVPDEVERTLPLRIFNTPTNIGTETISESFSTKLYVNGSLVEIREFNSLKPDERKGEWTKTDAYFATSQKGEYEVKLVVDAYDEIDEAIETNNVITETYTVTGAPSINCPGEYSWDGDKCVKTWTQHEVKKDRVNPVLIR